MFDQDLKIQKGFTLIELITIIVVISILAAIALPKFISLGQEARISSVNSLSGAVKSTANLWNGICLIKEAECKAASWPNSFNYQGKNVGIASLFPEAGDNINDNQIDTLIHADGFTVTLPDNLTTKFSLSFCDRPRQLFCILQTSD